jgi:superfamily I DNA and/or RNA helicase
LQEEVDRVLAREHPASLAEMAEVCREIAARVGGALDRSGGEGWWSRLRAAADCADAPGVREDMELRDRLGRVMELLWEVEELVVRRARVVATTLTQLFTARHFRRYTADTVVVDEASTASLAHAFVAASHASGRVVAAGDFMQLPAVVQSRQGDARRWLGGNVFQSARCDRPLEPHPLRVMLDEQWRMQPGISAVVSQVFYAGLLRDAPGVTGRAAAAPVALLLDTAHLRPRTERPGGGSKGNRVHAELVARLVALAGEEEIAVIAPYRAQVRLLREAIRARNPEALESGRVEVFTVHRFQGRDKAIVIFDTVEAPGTDAPFLDDTATPEAPNLVNVALSRARERLVVMAHARHLREALGRESSLVRVCAALRLHGGLELDAAAPRAEETLERFLRVGR